MIARKDNFLIAIELKMSLTKQLIHACYINNISCDLSYAAVPTEPSDKSKALCRRYSIGIIKVEDKAGIILQVKERSKTIKYYHDSVLKYCSGIPWKGVGGLPQLKGIGPAIECGKRVKSYLVKNPINIHPIFSPPFN